MIQNHAFGLKSATGTCPDSITCAFAFSFCFLPYRTGATTISESEPHIAHNEIAAATGKCFPSECDSWWWCRVASDSFALTPVKQLKPCCQLDDASNLKHDKHWTG